MGLYPLLARAAAIAENENSSFAEALSLAAAERGTPLRRVFADEAEALSHDLGHGGAAEQRAVIDLDNGRIRLEYDHRAGSLRESLDALANHFPTAGANRIQNRLIAFLAEHDGSEELYKTLHNELGLTNQEIEAMGFDLAHRYEPDCDDAYQDIVDYIRFEQETSKMWPWLKNLPMVRWLIEQGADITIADKYGDRPYSVAVQNRNQEMADYLKGLEPEEWHNEQEKVRQLMPYKLPARLVEYLKTGPLRLEFPDQKWVKWAELYSYMDVQEMTWKRKKLLSLMAAMDNYSDYLLLWSPRDKKLWYLDIEHEEFHPLSKWDDFIADPGRYLNGMIEGEFEE